MMGIKVNCLNCSILTYSTCLWYLLTGCHSQRSWLSTEILPDRIGQIQAEVIVLNEVFLSSIYNQIRQKLRDDHDYQYSTEILMQNNWSRLLSGGVVVLSKYPIVKVEERMFKSCHFPEYFASKGFLYVQIEKDNQPIHLMATHLNSSTGPRFEDDRPCREMQIYEMMAFYRQLGIPQEETLIIAGDLNVNRYYHEEYQAMLELFQAHEPEYAGQDFTYDELYNPLVTCGEGRQWLDYVLVKKKGDQQIKKLENKSLVLKHEDLDLSDHYAVLAEIEF